jgi:hypothetical protein
MYLDWVIVPTAAKNKNLLLRQREQPRNNPYDDKGVTKGHRKPAEQVQQETPEGAPGLYYALKITVEIPGGKQGNKNNQRYQYVAQLYIHISSFIATFFTFLYFHIL